MPPTLILCLIYRSGAKCWYPDSPHYTHILDMIPQFRPKIYHGNWLLVAADEWRKMLDPWAWFCFQMTAFFIVVHTPDMGLGIVFFMYCRYPLFSCIYGMLLFVRYSICRDS
jgi:hypothetical protein